jgi:hypothetical protein
VVDADALRLFAVLGVAEHAHLERGAGDGGERHRAVEALVLLRVILLQADLQLDRLGELAGLRLGLVEDERDAVAEGVGSKLAVTRNERWKRGGGERDVQLMGRAKNQMQRCRCHSLHTGRFRFVRRVAPCTYAFPPHPMSPSPPSTCRSVA